MEECIFSKDILNEKTKPEHILICASGGRKRSKNITCSDCNQKFGGTIDNALANQIGIIRNLLQLKSGIGNPPPMIKDIKSGCDRLNLNSDGESILVMKPFTLNDRGNGAFDIQIKIRTLEELEKIIPHVAKVTKRSEEEVRTAIKGGDSRFIQKRPEPIDHQLSLGGTEVMRAIVKSCLELWAGVVGNIEVKGFSYNDSRCFVIEGGDALNEKLVKIDSRSLPGMDFIKKDYGEFFNLIYVNSNAKGRVIGHFTLYNIISWQVILAESGGTPNEMIALVSDPQNPSVWSDSIASQLEINFDWLESPYYNLDQAKSRLEKVFLSYVDLTKEKVLGKIIDNIFDKNIVEDKFLDAEDVKKICNEMAAQVSCYLLGLPYEQNISIEEISRYL